MAAMSIGVPEPAAEVLEEVKANPLYPNPTQLPLPTQSSPLCQLLPCLRDPGNRVDRCKTQIMLPLRCCNPASIHFPTVSLWLPGAYFAQTASLSPVQARYLAFARISQILYMIHDTILSFSDWCHERCQKCVCGSDTNGCDLFTDENGFVFQWATAVRVVIFYQCVVPTVSAGTCHMIWPSGRNKSPPVIPWSRCLQCCGICGGRKHQPRTCSREHLNPLSLINQGNQ